MGDTFHAIVVGECLPRTRKGEAVADMGYVRPFEDGFSDTQALLTHLGQPTRAKLTRTGVWLVNMSSVPGGYVTDRDAAVAKWKGDLEGPASGGLFRATRRNLRVLCLSNFVARDVAAAHDLLHPIPCIASGPTICRMSGGGKWQFATWFRTDMRVGRHAELVRGFLERPRKAVQGRGTYRPRVSG